MNVKYIIGGLIIVVFMIWGFSAFINTTIQYVSISEALESPRMVQVMGKINFDKVNYNTEETQLEFEVYDAEAESMVGAETMNVVYHGVVPGNFDQATSVVLKGKPDDQGTFVAETMLVKCPSKYQGEGGEYQDGEKHDEATSEGAGV